MGTPQPFQNPQMDVRAAHRGVTTVTRAVLEKPVRARSELIPGLRKA